jgi:hypothetical protein
MRCSHERALKTTERPELRTGLQCAMQGSPAKVAGAARSEKYERRKTSRDNHGLGGNQERGGPDGVGEARPSSPYLPAKEGGQNVRRNHCASACLTSDEAAAAAAQRAV